MKRFVTSALVAITVCAVCASVTQAQKPVKKIGKARLSPTPGGGADTLSKAADIIQKRNSRTPAQKPVKKIGKPRAEYIQCAANGLNLDANPRKAGEVYLWGPNGGSPQQWRLIPAQLPGDYYIESVSNGLRLTYNFERQIVLMPYMLGHMYQTWKLTPVAGEKGSLGSGLYYIDNAQNQGRLQLNPATKGNGAKLILDGRTGSHLQRWRLLSAGSSPKLN